MRLDSETENDIRVAKKLWLPWWAVLLLLLVGTPSVWLFDHFGRLDLFLPTWNTIFVLGFLVVVKRKLWRHAWFWIVMTFITATHVELILLIPWTTKWVPAVAIGAIDSLDFTVLLTIINYFGRLTEGPKNAL